MVEIEIGGQRATVENGEWSAENPEVLAAVESPPRPFIHGGHPHPDLELARNVVEIFGGRILDEGEPLPLDPSTPDNAVF